MESLITQYPAQILLVWVLLNFLHHFFNYLNSKLYKNLTYFDSESGVKYNRKFILKFLLWLGFGIGMLAAYRQAMLEKDVTVYQCFVWFGAFFFLMIGYILIDIIILVKYFIYRREISKLTTHSFKASMIVYSLEFFGYSILLLISFFIAENPFLLGGTIGLAFGGGLYLLELTRENNSKIEQNQKIK